MWFARYRPLSLQPRVARELRRHPAPKSGGSNIVFLKGPLPATWVKFEYPQRGIVPYAKSANGTYHKELTNREGRASEALQHCESHWSVVAHEEVYEAVGVSEVDCSALSHRVVTVGTGQRPAKLRKVVQVERKKVLNSASQRAVHADDGNRRNLIEFGHWVIVSSTRETEFDQVAKGWHG